MKRAALQQAVKPIGNHKATLIQDHSDQLSVGHLYRLSGAQNLVLPGAIGFDDQDHPVYFGCQERRFV